VSTISQEVADAFKWSGVKKEEDAQRYLEGGRGEMGLKFPKSKFSPQKTKSVI